MISAFTNAIAAARETSAGIQNRLHSWVSVEGAPGVVTLVCLSYIEGGAVEATAVWSGADNKGGIALLIDHLNEEAGAGPELVDALANVYRKNTRGSGLLGHAVFAGQMIIH